MSKLKDLKILWSVIIFALVSYLFAYIILQLYYNSNIPAPLFVAYSLIPIDFLCVLIYSLIYYRIKKIRQISSKSQLSIVFVVSFFIEVNTVILSLLTENILIGPMFLWGFGNIITIPFTYFLSKEIIGYFVGQYNN